MGYLNRVLNFLLLVCRYFFGFEKEERYDEKDVFLQIRVGGWLLVMILLDFYIFLLRIFVYKWDFVFLFKELRNIIKMEIFVFKFFGGNKVSNF